MEDKEFTADALRKDLEPLSDAPMAPAHVVASLALNFALKYHNINTVQDGLLYQQYKLEGKNMRPFELEHVFETAMKMEAWLVGSNQRIADLLINALEVAVENSENKEDKDGG